MAELSVKALCVGLGLMLSYILYSSVYRALRSGQFFPDDITIGFAINVGLSLVLLFVGFIFMAMLGILAKQLDKP
jgi:hypothetical protein